MVQENFTRGAMSGPIEPRANVCDYWGCEKGLAAGKDKVTQGMRFCEEHTAECHRLIDVQDVYGLLKFWVDASGGAKRMAQTPSGIYQSHIKAGAEPK